MSKVGLILSGGIAKGAYQVGALRAVQKYVDLNDVVAVSAASVGALNAFAYCGGRLELATKMWADINKLKSRVNIYTLLRSDYLQGALNAMSKLKLKVPSFFLPVFRINGRKLIYQELVGMEREALKDHLNAAVSFITPYKMNGEYYYDGALFDNIPVAPLKDLDLDYIICIYFDKHNYMFETPELNSNIIKISFCEDDFFEKSLIFSRENTNKMIIEGEEHANAVLEFVFSGGNDVEQIKKRIAHLNSINKGQKLRITIDTVLTNINKLSKRIARKEVQ